ncbi:MAG: SH3 domain-containing protein [Armatimonadota bacterium]
MEALGDNQGMIYQDMVNVRSGPSDQFQAIAVMPAGVVFQVLGQSNGWYKGAVRDGTEGWVASWLCVANAMPAPGGGPVTIVPASAPAAAAGTRDGWPADGHRQRDRGASASRSRGSRTYG